MQLRCSWTTTTRGKGHLYVSYGLKLKGNHNLIRHHAWSISSPQIVITSPNHLCPQNHSPSPTTMVGRQKMGTGCLSQYLAWTLSMIWKNSCEMTWQTTRLSHTTGALVLRKVIMQSYVYFFFPAGFLTEFLKKVTSVSASWRFSISYSKFWWCLVWNLL